MPTSLNLTRLDGISALAATLPAFDDRAADAARARQGRLTKPLGALGRLEDLAIWVAGWQGREIPTLEPCQALIFAGNHGICAQGVNPFPQAVTAQMVANFEAGGAAINQLCAVVGACLSVHALELERPTEDFTQRPAMTEADCVTALKAGAAAVDPDADAVLLGEMGIGNSTVAAALSAALFGGPVAEWVGAGTGADAEGIARKVKAVEAGLARHGGLGGMATLAALGGREQAAICGAILAARANRSIVILDGFICTAAAAPLFATMPALLDHCVIAHCSAEPGHARLAQAMNKRPLLDLGMRLGEGSGAALALGILRGAVACHAGMATFAEAGVSEA